MADHRLSQVLDPHRLAHVEDEYLAAGAERRRLHDQQDRLAGQHHEALHFRVGDGDRLAPDDGVAEDGRDAAPAVEHVPEPDRQEADPAAAVHCCRHRLADPFARAHHARRVDRLVGGDVDEALGAVFHRGAGHQVAALNVHADCLGRVELENWDVLVRGGVEYDLRPGLREDPADVRFAGDVTEEWYHVEFRKGRAQVVLDVEEVGVVPFQQDQHRRVELGELAAELRADRAARARDHDALAGKDVLHLPRVHLDRLLTGQFVDGQAFQGADIGPVVDQVRHGRDQPHLESEFVEPLVELAEGEGRVGTQEYERGFDSMSHDDRFDVVERPQHRHALADRVPVVRFRVDEADDPVVEARGSPQRIKQEVALVRAHHQNRPLSRFRADHLHVESPAAANRDDSADAQQPPGHGRQRSQAGENPRTGKAAEDERGYDAGKHQARNVNQGESGPLQLVV